MKSDLIRAAALAAMAVLAGSAAADHNSKWGEGWAKMPNDIHNTRVETKGDNEAFREFVQKGAGAESENRFATDTKGKRAETQATKKGTDKARARAERRRSERTATANRGQKRSMRGARSRGRR